MTRPRTRNDRRRHAALAIVSCAIGFVIEPARSITAQSHPDLSGKWTLTSDKPASFGKEFTITSDATSLHVDHVSTFDGGSVQHNPAGGAPISTTWTTNLPVHLTFKFDGSENLNALPLPEGKHLESVSTSTWDGGKFVIVTTQNLRLQLRQDEAVYVGDVIPGRGLPARDLLLPASQASRTIPAVSTRKQVIWLRADGTLVIDVLWVVDTGLSSEMPQPSTTKSLYTKGVEPRYAA